MDICFSINNREIVLGSKIENHLIEYSFKSTNTNPVYRIVLKGLNLKDIYFICKKDNTKMSAIDFLENLRFKEFRFIIGNEKLKLNDSNFIGVFENYNVNEGLLFATIKKCRN